MENISETNVDEHPHSGRYINNVVFSQMGDKSDSSKTNVPEEHIVEHNYNNNNNVAHGRKLKKNRPNFTKMHEDYKLSWRENPPPNETRPMRLMEFIFAYSSNKDNDIEEFSDDSFDISL